MTKKAFQSGLCGLALSTALLVPCSLHARQADATSSQDNTRTNKRDRKTSEPTADQGKNSSSDLELMRNIRRDVVKDKSLSTYGHNVKIIAEHGKVTLKGPVHTEEEKKAIMDHAQKYAGDGNIVDEITVKGDKK